MTLGKDKSWDQWIDEYAQAHQHPYNKACHHVGIPLIAISLLLIVPAIWVPSLVFPALGLFVLGWLLQFVGHYFEKKPPEFFRDWRFLFVGLRWWIKETFSSDKK